MNYEQAIRERAAGLRGCIKPEFSPRLAATAERLITEIETGWRLMIDPAVSARKTEEIRREIVRKTLPRLRVILVEMVDPEGGIAHVPPAVKVSL